MKDKKIEAARRLRDEGREGARRLMGALRAIDNFALDCKNAGLELSSRHRPQIIQEVLNDITRSVNRCLREGRTDK